jgi:AcrR family transcriptional regulator
MPKGFTDEQKKYLRKKLIDAGKEIFGRYGFKKASIDQAVHMAGISKGTFYLFFESKELFFMEVLESIEKEIRDGMVKMMEEKQLSPAERLKAFMRGFLKIMEKNPVMSKIQYQDLDTFMLNLPEEKMKNHMDRDMEFLLDFILNIHTASGRLRSIKRKALNGFFTFFIYIFQHKDDIGYEEYKAGTELMIDMASEYFFTS